MNRKSILALLSALMLSSVAVADEGMWMPVLIQNKIVDMSKAGGKLSAADIYDVNKASIKDAIVQFGGGCTGEIISSKGLLLTNHHCGFSQIQSHSSVENDYLKDGFVARTMGEELPNKGLNVKFLVRMDDVTEGVLNGYKEEMSEKERSSIIEINSKKIIADATKGSNLNATVESFYYGNQYFLFIYKIYRDVRLVMAPPSSIGKFGGDTDNWIWPRHTGDFSIFRVYAGKDNEPADYSPSNVPFTPKKYLKVSLNGYKEGDFTMVYGYPGRTQQYLYSDAVKFIVDKSNPIKIGLRTLRLNIQNVEMSKSQAVRIKYASKNANVANAWKKWQGEALGLKASQAIEKKIEFEKEFDKWSANRPEYNGLTSQFRKLYSEIEPYSILNDYINESVNVNELPKLAGTLSAQLSKMKEEERQSVEKYIISQLRDFYKDYYLPIDKSSFVAIMGEYCKNIDDRFKPEYLKTVLSKFGSVGEYADYLYSNSLLTDSLKAYASVKNGTFVNDLKNDPATIFYNEMNSDFNSRFKPALNDMNEKLSLLYRKYLKARMEFEKERNFYPDANSTLRVAYGKIVGYSPKDAILYRYYSTIDGIMEKDNPEIYDYDIPQKLRDIYKNKDYGIWGVKGTVPVCFIATNHTSGGNSGSPVLDARGNLIGINFDRVWEGTMSDVLFNPEICRNIILDIRYVMFVTDKVMGAKNLINEIEFAK